MPIDVGTEAPDFTLKTQDEAEWKLSAHRGKNVVLMWYPLDWSLTPGRGTLRAEASISRCRKNG